MLARQMYRGRAQTSAFAQGANSAPGKGFELNRAYPTFLTSDHSRGRM